MKRFLFKLALFSVTCFVVINIAAAIHDRIQPSRVEDPGGEIYDAIKRSHQATSATSLVVGDSVSHQLMTGYAPPEILSLCSNQAISVCGQYMLAHAALDRNPSIKQVTLAYQPSIFANNLDQPFTYNYFVRPFFPYAKFRADMSSLVMQRIDRRPFARLVVFPIFRYTTLLSDIDYSAGAGKPPYKYFAPVSVEYLQKFAGLCEQRGIKFRIVSTPISTDRDYDRAQFFKEVADAHLEKLFGGYADTVRLVDPTLLVDHVHFKKENIAANSAIFVKMLRGDLPGSGRN